MNLWAIFLTGLTTGGLSCLAMQGGLLASIIANQKEEEIEGVEHEVADEVRKRPRKEKRRVRYLQPTQLQINTAPKSFDQLDWLPVGLFLAAKLIAHTLLGFFLGWLGSQIELSITARLLFQGMAAVFMLATAANLLNLHPIFRYVVFQPPKFIQRMVRNTTKSKALFTPAILGMMTIFIPCGVTQAMEVLAITSGSAIQGALIMFFFVLGTSPLFALVGVATAKLSETYRQSFMKIAAVILILLGLSSLNGILVVLNSPITFEKVTYPIVSLFTDERFAAYEKMAPAREVGGIQRVLIEVKSSGYSPNRLKVKAGIPVELTLQTTNSYSCASSFILKGFGIKMQLGPNDRQVANFTPTQKGEYPFSCSMGMYTGLIEVI